jgi:hypothetical protein
MTEILTESFCERCGTRYTFESARPKTRLKGVKVLSRGLKNFVLSDDTSIDEAMAAARSESDREATAHQLDAFHRTFNFCMGCRQYTCPNCWNEAEVRCLSCAPLELPAAPVRLEDLGAFAGSGLIGEAELIGADPGNGTAAHDVEPPVEPMAASTETQAPEQSAVTEELAPPEPVAAEPIETASAKAAGPAAEPSAVGDDVDPAGKAAAQTTGLLKRFRPGQSIDEELAAFEAERTEAEQVAAAPTEPEPEIAASGAGEPEPEMAASAESEPEAEIAASAASEPALETPAPQAVEPEPEPAPLAAAAAADLVEQPTWRVTAPDPGATAPVVPPTAPGGSIPLQASAAPPDASAEPQWPSRPQWPSATPAAGLPFLGRPATPEGGIEALWAASNQELVTAAPQVGKPAASGIQPCISCGLSLSATARFCRRCGTLQDR